MSQSLKIIFQYIPNTNKLLIFGNGSAQSNISIYRYDGNGSMTSDPNAGINFVIYDCNNMPLIEYKGNQKLEYTYDANGTRISKTVGKNNTYYTTGVTGNSEMETIVGASTTSRYYIWGLDHLGHITSAMHYYYLKDHLGSIRMTINKNGKVVSYNDYYPYGSIMPMRSKNIAMADERYKFIGKEQDAETGYDWFGVRGYDGLECRLLTIDPHSISYPGLSPYAYAGDNPISYLDPTGMDSTQAQQLNEALSTTHNNNKNDHLVCLKLVVKALTQYLSLQGATVPDEILSALINGTGANGAIDNIEASENFTKTDAKSAMQEGSNGGVTVAVERGKNHGHIDLIGAGKSQPTTIKDLKGNNPVALGSSGYALRESWEERGKISASFSNSPTYYHYNGFIPRPSGGVAQSTSSSILQQPSLMQVITNVMMNGYGR